MLFIILIYEYEMSQFRIKITQDDKIRQCF